MNKNLKLLIVADTLDIDSSSGAKTSMAVIESLVRCGHQVNVLHYTRKPVAIEGAQSIEISEKRTTFSYWASKLQVKVKKLTGYNYNKFKEKTSGFSYAHDYDVNSINAAIQQEKSSNYDYILALSYASSFRAHKAIMQLPGWHPKFLAYIHDPYPMHSYPRPYDWVEPGHRFKRDFFIELCTAAEKIIYPSQLLAEWMEGYYPTAKGKAVTIPHQFTTVTPAADFPDFFDPSKFNILHAGNLMTARKPHALVRAFARFLEQNPQAKKDARLIFVGKRSIFNDFFKETHRKHPQFISSPDYIAFAKVFAMQQAASVNVILEAKGPTSPFLPGKMAHCVQADKPILVLGPYYSEVRRLLGHGYPFWSEIDDEEKILQMLHELFEQWKQKNSDFKLNRSDLQHYFGSGYMAEVIDALKGKNDG